MNAVKVDLATIIAALLTTGAGAFIAALVRSWRDLRAGARAGQREVVHDLMEWRDDLDHKLRVVCADRDFWRDVAAARGHQIRTPCPKTPHTSATGWST